MAAEKVKCNECESAIAEIQNGALLIRSRHHGEQHVNSISLDWLKKKLEEMETGSDKMSA